MKSYIDGSAETLKDVNSIKEFESKLIDGSDSQYGLAKVLEMLVTGYGTLIKSLSDFMELSFDTDDEKKKARRILLDGKMGIIEAQLQGARSRCTKIELIHKDFLQGWFDSKKLEATQLNALNELFKEKLFHDEIFTEEMVSVGNVLRKASTDTYDLVISGDYAQAKRKVEKFTQEVQPALTKLSHEWQQLKGLVADFTQNLQ